MLQIHCTISTTRPARSVHLMRNEHMHAGYPSHGVDTLFTPPPAIFAFHIAPHSSVPRLLTSLPTPHSSLLTRHSRVTLEVTLAPSHSSAMADAAVGMAAADDDWDEGEVVAAGGDGSSSSSSMAVYERLLALPPGMNGAWLWWRQLLWLAHHSPTHSPTSTR